MKLLTKMISAICVCIFISCNKPGNSPNTPTSDTTHLNPDTTAIAQDSIFPPANVYIVGDEWDGTHNFIKYWNNGKCFPVGDSLHKYYPTSICVSGSDVYISGFDNFSGYDNAAEYWKNGVATKLVDSSKSSIATDVTVSDNDLYVLEQEYYDSLPNYRLYTVKYWKNGNPVTLITRDGWAGGNSIFVTGNDVYVAGSATYEKNGINYYPAAVYWKNGKIVYLTDGSKEAAATSIFVSGSDVYVAGTVYDSVKYWKNGVPINLSNSQSIGWSNKWLISIAVNGSDVYMAGWVSASGNQSIARYWKNGIGQDLFIADNGIASTTGIAFSGNDVYISGYGNDKAMYWKNGVAHVLPTYPFNYNLLWAKGIFITK